ncbi:hypothetical protein [Modestobacter altitudinis]|uniref:hypothetical protein n=1 Tax=Modestobacter altitudinis TaxID=2213158 RepID=UPI00110CA88C|nr:hypothetical protein [Modestobacter altitudinis]
MSNAITARRLIELVGPNAVITYLAPEPTEAVVALGAACGLAAANGALISRFLPRQTLKRNSTTSPSAMTSLPGVHSATGPRP